MRHGHFLKSTRGMGTPPTGGLVYVSRKPEVSGISRVLTQMKGTPIPKIRKKEEINRKGMLREPPYTHTLSLFMKEIPWWSLLLEEVHNSLISLTQCSIGWIAETCFLTFENILARHLQATGFSNEEEILVKWEKNALLQEVENVMVSSSWTSRECVYGLGEGKWTLHVWDLESPNVSKSSIWNNPILPDLPVSP